MKTALKIQLDFDQGASMSEPNQKHQSLHSTYFKYSGFPFGPPFKPQESLILPTTS